MTITGMEFLICSDDLEWRDQTESGEKGERGKGKLLCLRLCLEAVQWWLCSGGCVVVAV